MAAKKAAKKPAAKAPAKKTAAKKPAPKKAPAKKTAAKAAPKKAPAKKAAAKRAPAKKTAAKKTAPKKTAAKKTAAKAAPKKTAPKKTAAKTGARAAPAKTPSAKAGRGAAKKAPARRLGRAPQELAAEALAPAEATSAVAVAPESVEGEGTQQAPEEETRAERPAAAAAPPAAAGDETAVPETTGSAQASAPAEGAAPSHLNGTAPATPALKQGDSAPDFTLPDQFDHPVHLAELRGRKVVLYFYPRDNTPGCTIEAKDFSSLLGEFEAKGALVYGVSTDPTASHRKFQHNCELRVPLLSDEDARVHKLFGVWQERNMYDRKVMGTVRTTFLLDEEGKVLRVWPKVKVEDHAAEVLEALG